VLFLGHDKYLGKDRNRNRLSAKKSTPQEEYQDLLYYLLKLKNYSVTD
jgi:hypothetical protein